MKAALAAVLLACASISPSNGAETRATDGDSMDRALSLSRPAALATLRFEENLGQAPSEARFLARNRDHVLVLTVEGPRLIAAGGKAGKSVSVLDLRFAGASAPLSVKAEDRLPGHVNYLIGASPDHWHTGIPTYGRVRYRGVYPGIDVVFRGNGRALEYDFEIAPGASVADVRVSFEGAALVKNQADGTLVIRLANATVTQPKPHIFQFRNGERVSVEGGYLLREDNTVGFEVASYDHSLPLIIDPVLEFSTFLGGQADDGGLAVTVGPDGGAYVTGTTRSVDFPVQNAPQASFAGGLTDAFVAKLTPDGSALAFATYIGGSRTDIANAIAVGENGEVVVAGTTNSSADFPLVNALQPQYGGGLTDGFVLGLSADGAALNFSTYLGGSRADGARGIDTDSSGSAFVAGFTVSRDFPVLNALQSGFGGGLNDAFVAKLAPGGAALTFATYIGGSRADAANGIALDSSGNALIAGNTTSYADFPTANAYQSTYGGGLNDGFVLKLTTDGSALAFSTYFGGSRLDPVTAIATDADGNAYITGGTLSGTGFPLKDPLQGLHGGESDAFAAKFSSDGALEYSTYLGGAMEDVGRGIAVDRAGNAIVTGRTASSAAQGFPIVNAVQSALVGESDAFVLKLTSNGDALVYSTYLGGSLNDKGTAVAADLEGNAIVTGRTGSLSDFPVVNAMQPFAGGSGDDAFIAKIRSNTAPAFVSDPKTEGRVGQTYAYAAEAQDPDGDTLAFRLREFPEGMSVDAATGEVTWVPPAAGSFDVVLEVQDGRGGAASQTFVIVVTAGDDIAPVITVTSPPNGSFSNQNPLPVTGLLSEPAELTVAGQSVPVNPDLSFSAFVPLNEGLNVIGLTAVDAAGNVGSATLSVTLDSIVPVLTLTAPADNTLTTDPDITVSGSVSEPVDLDLNGQPLTLNPDNTFSTVFTLSEGNNTLIVTAADAAGNTDAETVSVILDTTPPPAPDLNLITRSNPSNGIVSINGNPGAVEAGTLVHVINLTSGNIARVLAQTDGSFTTGIAAFANDDLEIYAVDAAGNRGASAILGPSAPLALTLDPIGDKIAPLGQITRFTVTASDAGGNPVTLGLKPVPLPDNMEYNLATGEFEFQPDAGQAGTYTLTFSAAAGDERLTETVTVTVPAANPADPTVFTGRILDANAMQAGDMVPVVGATISFLETGVVTTTDVEGFFTLSNLPASATVFDIDGSTAQPAPNGSGYASFREGLPIISNVINRVERPFFMPRLDAASATLVDPNQTTVVNNSNLGITLTVPPGTAVNDADGTLFTGVLTISEVPRNLAPANLPEFMDPALLITIQPVGVSYTRPVAITFANTESYAPGSEVDIWSVDPDLGQFVVVGTGRVSTDGQIIETIGGGIRANDWHTRQPPETQPDPNGKPLKDPDNPCPICQCRMGGSSFSLHEGHMSTGFTLPAYRSLEASRGLRFLYQSLRAYPRPVVAFNGQVSVRSTVPAAVSYRLEVAGLEQGEEVFIDTSGFDENIDEPFRTAITFDAADFPSGSYAYRLEVTSNFFGGTRSSLFVTGPVMVHNEQASPFGAGWMLGGLYRLAFNDDGAPSAGDNSITLVAPDCHSLTYRPTGAPDEYASPDNDFAEFRRNPDGSYSHTEKDGTVMRFDADGLLTERVDRNGNVTAYGYNDEGNLETITDPVGLVTTFVYGINGLLESVTDPAERVSRFEHDPLGNLVRITYPDGTFETFEYDDRHLMVAHEDERENRFEDIYDVFGRVVKAILPDDTVREVTGKTAVGLVDVSSGIGTAANPAPVTRPEAVAGTYTDGRGNRSRQELDSHGRATLEVDEVGRVTTHQRDADSNPTQTTRPIGSVVTRTFDDFGNVLTQTEEFNGATTTYTYDPFSLVTSVTNPRDHTTTITRDPANGNPLSIVNHLGHTTTMEYDPRGLVTRMESPNGLVTTYAYNAQGLLETKTETPPPTSPGNVRVTQYSYFPTGLLKQVVTPDLIVLDYSYDERSFLTSVTDNLNQSIVYTYDAHKNVIQTETTSEDGSLALLVDSVYDNRNRLTETRAPHLGTEASITRRILDENSNLVGLIDPNGNPSSNTYDPFNRLDSNTHREAGVTQYEYDDQDRIVKVTAPNGAVTEYEYDIISRRTKEISPDRGALTYTYDLADNVTSVTDGRGITASMTYDELERVANKTYPNTIAGKVEDVTYTYDACAFGLGYLCARTDESGSYAYEYDAFGNLTASTFTEREGTVYQTSYLYDDGDRVIESTYPSGRAVNYARDGVRRIAAIDATVNGASRSIVSGIKYRGDNQVTECVFGNGLIDARTYDLQGRLVSQLLRDEANVVIDQRSYSYDLNSNILNIDTDFEDNAYAYDKLDRVTADAIDANIPIEFSYDLNDNRFARNPADLSRQDTYRYTPESNRLESIEVFTPSGPAPVIPKDRELVFNDASRLYQIIENGVLKAEYFYNDEGQRTRKVVYQADGATVESVTIFHYDHMGYLITETNEAGQLIRDYIWTENMHPVAQIDDLLGTEVVSYLYTDHLMTNRLATDEFQQVVWRWEGEAFGNTPAQEVSGVSVNLRFPGQYFDQETNLHYNWHRYYDPELGRYITSDPVGLEAGANSYSYVRKNPNRYFDRNGLKVRFICRPMGNLLGEVGIDHCFIYVTCPAEGWARVLSLFGDKGSGYREGYKYSYDPWNPTVGGDPDMDLGRDDPNSADNRSYDVPDPVGCRKDRCGFEKEVLDRYYSYPWGNQPYHPLGPNSNTRARDLVGGYLPPGVTGSNAPGVNHGYPPRGPGPGFGVGGGS